MKVCRAEEEDEERRTGQEVEDGGGRTRWWKKTKKKKNKYRSLLLEGQAFASKALERWASVWTYAGVGGSVGAASVG